MTLVEPPTSPQTAPGRLAVAGGPFRVLLPIGPVEAFPFPDPQPERHSPWKGGLQPIIRRLQPFIGQDASRPWACGIWLSERVAAATNNVVIAVSTLPHPWPVPVVLPVHAVEELLRMDLEPTHIQVTNDAVAFWFPDGIWLKTNLLEGQWPKTPTEVIAELHEKARWQAIPPVLKTAVGQLQPFVDDIKSPVVIIERDRVKVRELTMFAEVTGFQIQEKAPLAEEPVTGPWAFRVEPLRAMLEVATHMDLSLFPRVPWKGPGIKGAIVGLRS